MSKAEYHWSEGNKYAAEFAKSIFQFNSAALLAVIGYTGTTNYYSSEIQYALIFFVISAVSGMFLFVSAYFAELNYANSHTHSPDKAGVEAAENQWRRGQRWHMVCYAITVMTFITTILSWIFLINAVKEKLG